MDLLFDDIARDYVVPAKHSWSEYVFLNRSAQPAADAVRRALNGWFSRYPERERRKLRTRLATEFQQVFTELVLHEVLVRAGARVTTHPSLPSSTRKPDFLVADDGASFVLEAAVVTDEKPADRARKRVEAVLYDAIEELDVPDFFLHVKSISNPRNVQPSGKRIRRFLAERLAETSYDHVRTLADSNRFDDLPTWTYHDGNIEIDIGVFPVSTAYRGAPEHRPIGAFPIESRWGTSATAVRRVVEKKAARYGDPGMPYVVAVNILGPWGCDDDDLLQALLGSEVVEVDNSARETRLVRRPGGAWHGRRPRNRRLSAVLALPSMVPWSLAVVEGKLFLNPWAHRALERTCLLRLPTVTVQQGHVIRSPGERFGSLLGVTPGWPGKLFP